jgi:hypothetical protein
MHSRHRYAVAASIAAALLLGSATIASADRQIHLATEYTTSGAPAPGWSFFWNKNGPIGNSANYVPLVRDANGDWETVANGQYPDPAPGNGLRISPFFGAINRVDVVPGNGAIQQTTNAFNRYAIVAYTIQPSDIAAAGVQSGGAANAVMDTYEFSVAATSADGIDSVIYLNNNQIVSSPLPPGLFYDQNSPGAYPVPLGQLHAGDTIYIATGPGFLPTATDIGDGLRMDFKITLTPEPAMLSMLCLTLVGLFGRRRLTRRTAPQTPP